eukprot:3780724-Rhodomonas_salina.1
MPDVRHAREMPHMIRSTRQIHDVRDRFVRVPSTDAVFGNLTFASDTCEMRQNRDRKTSNVM